MDTLFEALIWLTPLLGVLAAMAWLADWLEDLEDPLGVRPDAAQAPTPVVQNALKPGDHERSAAPKKLDPTAARGEADGVVATGTVSPPEFRPNVDRICPYCGAKHRGAFQACATCKTAVDSGDSR